MTEVSRSLHTPSPPLPEIREIRFPDPVGPVMISPGTRCLGMSGCSLISHPLKVPWCWTDFWSEKTWSPGHLGPWNQKANTPRDVKEDEMVGVWAAVYLQSVLGSCDEGDPILHISSIPFAKLVN